VSKEKQISTLASGDSSRSFASKRNIPFSGSSLIGHLLLRFGFGLAFRAFFAEVEEVEDGAKGRREEEEEEEEDFLGEEEGEDKGEEEGPTLGEVLALAFVTLEEERDEEEGVFLGLLRKVKLG